MDADERDRRVSELIAALPRLVRTAGFQQDPGPHRATIERRRELGSAAASARDSSFVTSLRETLWDWGVGRRGPPLADAERFAGTLAEAVPALQALEEEQLDDTSLDVPAVAERLHEALWALGGITEAKRKRVATTKALHHLLPDLVVPTDSKYTVGFLGTLSMSVRSLSKSYEVFHRIGVEGKAASLVAEGTWNWNSSVPKVVDNGIIGYWRAFLRRLDVAAVQERLRRFAAARAWGQFHTPKNLAMALSAEAGELLEVFQWLTPEESLDLPQEERGRAREEVADIAIYLLRIADVLDLDLGSAIDEKLEQNKRKYPVDEAYGNARKYDRRGRDA